MERKALLGFTSAVLASGLMLVATWAALVIAGAQAAASDMGPNNMVSPGDIVINEVAWMGTAASSWDEWIELYNNTGSAVTLTGWWLEFGDGSPSTITLDGVISPGAYFLLERAETATDVIADGIYGGGQMHNAGESLALKDAHGAVIDTANVDGSTWPAGSASPDYVSMERTDPTAPDSSGNWADNDGFTRNGHDADRNPINGTPKARNSAVSTPAVHEADLIIGKSGPITALAGTAITYTIRVSNAGFLTAAGVRITDSLPTDAAFLAQNSAFAFGADGNTLHWSVGDVPTRSTPLLITITCRINLTTAGVIQNIVTGTTVTTETIGFNNQATVDTTITGEPENARLLIAGLLYDGYALGDLDEAIQLINVGSTPANLSNWRICDSADGGSCATIVSGTLGVGEPIWLAYWASDFFMSSGVFPGYAVKGLAPGVLALSGSWPGYANDGDEAVLIDAAGNAVDTLVYEDGVTNSWGWQGPAVEPWQVGSEGLSGQILYRRLNEITGLPVADTDTAADWAQYTAEPAEGRRVRYPGWDLTTFFQPITATESAHLTVGIAPDNAADIVLSALEAAESQIEIGAYSLRHPTIISSLAEKANAGVTVTVLLEGDPVALAKTDPRWYQQMWGCETLHDTGHSTCWFMIDDPQNTIFDRYRYMHAKYILIDREQVLITSQNLTARGMPDDNLSNGTYGSRGVVLLTDAPSLVARVAQVFDHDLDPDHHVDLMPWMPSGAVYGPPPLGFHPALSVTDFTSYSVVFSRSLTVAGTFQFELFTAPEASLRQRDALLGLLARVGDGDEIYIEQLDERAHWGLNPSDDPSLRMEAYIEAARRGARVRMLLNGGQFDAGYFEDPENLEAAAYANRIARQEGLNLKAVVGDPTQYGIHNKMVLVWLEGKGGYIHLGSLNGSETANKVNRELAIQVQSDEAYSYLKRLFDWDWFLTSPVLMPVVFRNWSPPEPPVGYPVVSEVLYDPSGADESGEWVEIYNPSINAVDLTGWYLGDVGPEGEFGSGLYTFPERAVLPSGGIILIARQAADVMGFRPDYEFLIDPQRDMPEVPNMVRAGSWEGFGFALGNGGDEVILLNAAASAVDVLAYGTGAYPGVITHAGVSAYGHSLERRPAIYDTDDCSRDFFDRYPPEPGAVSRD